MRHHVLPRGSLQLVSPRCMRHMAADWLFAELFSAALQPRPDTYFGVFNIAFNRKKVLGGPL